MKGSYNIGPLARSKWEPILDRDFGPAVSAARYRKRLPLSGLVVFELCRPSRFSTTTCWVSAELRALLMQARASAHRVRERDEETFT